MNHVLRVAPDFPGQCQPCSQSPETVHTIKPAKYMLGYPFQMPILFSELLYIQLTPSFRPRTKHSLTTSASKVCVFVLLVGYIVTNLSKFLYNLCNWSGNRPIHVLYTSPVWSSNPGSHLQLTRVMPLPTLLWNSNTVPTSPL